MHKPYKSLWYTRIPLSSVACCFQIGYSGDSYDILVRFKKFQTKFTFRKIKINNTKKILKNSSFCLLFSVRFLYDIEVAITLPRLVLSQIVWLESVPQFSSIYYKLVGTFTKESSFYGTFWPGSNLTGSLFKYIQPRILLDMV